MALVLAMAGCGSGSKNSSSGGSQPINVALNQTAVTIATGAPSQFTATVTGTSNTAVSWSVDGVSGGNSTTGMISSSGLYTAPAQVGSHTVMATSVASASSSAQASVSVVAGVGVSPSSATLNGASGQTQQFTATVVSSSNQSVTWSVDGIAGGNSSVGAISSSGLYTSPDGSGSHTVTATSVANPGQSANASVSIFTFSISPTTAMVAPSGTQQFNSSLQGFSSNTVNWSVDGVLGGNSATGTISSSGAYTAPASIGPHTIQAASAADSSAMVAAQLTVVNSGQAAVLTYHNDDTRDGAFTQEVTLTPSNVNSTQFGKVAAYPVDGQIYAQPLYMPQLSINSGTHDTVFVATMNDSVYAFDANAASTSLSTFWHVKLGTAVSVNDPQGPSPIVGILSTPVIDATTNTMYLVTENSGTSSTFYLHALNVTNGIDQPGSPVAVNATDPNSGETLESSCYQRMGLALDPVTNWIYIAFGSCTHGWVLAYDKASLVQKAVFNVTSGAAGGGLWGGGGAPAIDDISGNIYLMSGTDYDDAWISPPPAYSQTGYNDSFLNLNPATLAVQSYFSPDNNYTLSTNDADLGSGADILIPGNSQYPQEVIGGGKDGNVFIVNPENMGGFSGTNDILQTLNIGTTQYDNIFSTPVYWNGFLYYHHNSDVLRAYAWNASANAGKQLASQPTYAGTVFNMHGATPSLSSNGNSNGIVWDIDNSAYQSGPAVLHAYNAANVAQELYNSAQVASRDQAGSALKFTVPTIANGRVFVPTASELDIYGLLQ
ncbi:MAG TPA: hypothetical protein VND65_06470 [Candidatus Binatia bacterium]|nr:hypothetical protein [Candidatus Binatia bacterium]